MPSFENVKEEISLFTNLVESELDDFIEWLTKLYRTSKKAPAYPEPSQEDLPTGTGIVTMDTEHRADLEKIAESLRTHKGKLTEQWVRKAGDLTTKEITGHIRDFLNVSQVLKDEPGDKVRIPYVKDFDMGDWGTYGAATLNDLTGATQVGSGEYTVQEAGLKLKIGYHEIEKLDADVLAKLEEKIEKASLRGEDSKVLAEMSGTSDILTLDKSGEADAFDADWIAEAIQKFETAGKEIEPGDLVCFVTPAQYEALLKDVAGSMGITFARPDIVKTGRLTEFMSVTIRQVAKSIMPDDTTNKYAFVFIKNKGHVFAPKRNILIETEKEPRERSIYITGTHCLAFGVFDPKTILRITTNEAA